MYNNVGEAQYKQRLEDIRILKLDIKRMRREKNILSKSVANVEDLRWDILDDYVVGEVLECILLLDVNYTMFNVRF